MRLKHIEQRLTRLFSSNQKKAKRKIRRRKKGAVNLGKVTAIITLALLVITMAKVSWTENFPALHVTTPSPTPSVYSL
jgi:hypothetical protein